MSKPNKKEVVLGSGTLYHYEYTDGDLIPANEVIEVEANIVGAIKGGASVTFSQTIVQESDDSGAITVTIYQGDESTLKAGLMTLTGDTFKMLAATAKVSEANGITTIFLGGVQNFDGKSHLFHFVNDNPTRKVRVTIVGLNQGGLELAFKKEGATIVDLEVKGEALNSTGAKLKLQLGEIVGA